MMPSDLSVFAPWVIAFVALAVAVLGWLRPRGDGDEEVADRIARLHMMLDRDAQDRVNEAEYQRARLVDVERSLSARLEHHQLAVVDRLSALTQRIGQDQAEARVAQANALREMAQESGRQLGLIREAVNEQLHDAVEKQMQSSFQRVIEQFSAMQKAMGEVTAVTAQIGDLKRLFGNVKTRGGWGEAQLRAILDDVLPPGSYDHNFRVGDGGEVVEFALHMPVRAERKPRLAIDSKFPTEAYERLLLAVDQGDSDGERAARRGLESAVKFEARKIASKYIVPPVTVEFAVLYLPTDGLYAEVARIPGLIDEIGRVHRVLVMGPSLIPALLRTVHLGYVTLALEDRTEAIARLLGLTRQEMLKMDGVLEKLSRNAGTLSGTIDEARRRTRVLGQKLRSLDVSGEGDGEESVRLEADFNVGN